MANQIRIQDIAAYQGQPVTINGWLSLKTGKGKLQFLRVRDGTGVVQAVVFRKDVSPEVFESAKRLTLESSLTLTGVVRADERAPGTPGGFEIGVTDLQIVQLAQEYPITPKEHSVEYLMENRHLWLRSSRQWAIMRIRATVVSAIRGWLDANGFINVDTPILTPAACEGTSTLFQTDYFGEPAYLTQSGQLYNEATIMAFGRVYCFGPTFRAEKSKTRRHLTEFWMVEPEMAFADLEECMRVQEQFVGHIAQTVLRERTPELETLERDPSPLRQIVPPFPRVSYDEAVDMLNRGGVPITWGEDFGSPHESFVAEQFDRPVFVHHYPTQCKAFYMEPDADRPEVCNSVDLLAPEGYGEIIGGGQRMSDLAQLEEAVRRHNLPREAYEWYLDLRRYGSTPHSGFGLGVERTVAWMCGIKHIRETIPFAHTLQRIYP